MRKLKKIIRSFWLKKIDPDEYAYDTSKRLVTFALHSAFKVFKDDEFRKYFNFSKQNKTEQDRLFNELAVTALCLLLFALEDISSRQGEEEYFWRKVQEQTPKVFCDWLSELGIAKQFVSIWGKLIDKRHEEYRRDLRDLRQEFENHNEVFIKEKNERIKDALVRFQAIAIGSIYHFRKGKTNPKDPFYKYLKTWLGVLNVQLEKKI